MPWTDAYFAGQEVLVRLDGAWQPATVVTVTAELVATNLAASDIPLLVDLPGDIRPASGAPVMLHKDGDPDSGHSWPATIDGLSDDGLLRLTLAGLEGRVTVPPAFVRHQRDL